MASGGFENDVFNNYKDDAFLDFLDTEIATDVIMYNYDLSERISMRVVVQGNLADTYLKSTSRTILAPIGSLKAGSYLYFEDNYWLINGRPGNNKVYEKAVVTLCSYELKWQKDDGTIVKRWASFTTASKYDIGEFGNYLLSNPSNNFIILIPNDEDSMTIENKRMFIDRAKPKKKVFRITRNDDVLLDYLDKGGILSLIADRDEFNPDTDNQDAEICNYIAPVLPPEEGTDEYELHLSYRGRNSIVVGGNAKKFSCYALSSDGQEVEMRSLIWSITALPENEEYITYTVNDDLSISVKCAYSEKIIGTQFLLKASLYDHSVSEFIEIGGGI